MSSPKLDKYGAPEREKISLKEHLREGSIDIGIGMWEMLKEIWYLPRLAFKVYPVPEGASQDYVADLKLANGTLRVVSGLVAVALIVGIAGLVLLAVL